MDIQQVLGHLLLYPLLVYKNKVVLVVLEMPLEGENPHPISRITLDLYDSYVNIRIFVGIGS